MHGFMHYSKPCLKRPLKKEQKLVSNTDYRLMQVKSIAECSNVSEKLPVFKFRYFGKYLDLIQRYG